MKKAFVLLLVLFFASTNSYAQDLAPPDTVLRDVQLKEVVVAADRNARLLSRSTAAVSVIDKKELRRQPFTNLADALQLAPGFAFLYLDGLGYAPQATVRGFYGGGETEYVQFLLNGKPMNNLERGVVNWNLINPKNVESIEVIRGGASSLYGDAAIGGVVNVVTKDASLMPSTRVSVEAGSYKTLVGRLRNAGRWRGRAYSVYGSVDRTEGFRRHAARRMGTLGGSFDLIAAPKHTLALSTVNHWQRYDKPGPIARATLDSSRKRVAPFYRFDETNERTHALTLDDDAQINEDAQLSSRLSGRWRTSDATRTLSLAPGFADTRDRDLTTRRLQASSQLTLDQLHLPVHTELTVGAEGSLGDIDTRNYFVRGGGNVLIGPASLYENADSAKRGDLADRGAGTRSTAAGYLQLDAFPTRRLRLSLGGRYDWLHDSFKPKAPNSGEQTNSTYTAFSPKVGLNYRYLQTALHTGSAYANVSQSFKAPTLDQFYDQRAVRFPGINTALSNPNLDPQHGTSYEVGLYHRATLTRSLSAALSLAVYQIDMQDELDYRLYENDPEKSPAYINIGESRHRGVEAALKLHLPAGVSAFGNYTYQAVKVEGGPFDGKYVKAIPRHAFNAGLSATHDSGLSGGITASGARRIYLDDANTIRLPNYTTVDLRLGYQFGAAMVDAEVRNVLDTAYSTTGNPDPSGQTNQVFLYPAAGRTVRLGISTTL